MVTMRDVAQAAQISYTTVSFVLNGRSDTMRISPETQRQVLETAERMGYRRNAVARSIATGKSQMFGFLTVLPEYEPFSRMLVGAIEEAETADYTFKVLRATADSIRQRFDRCLELRLAGLIILHKSAKKIVSAIDGDIRRHNIPVVYLEELETQEHSVHVISDEMQGAALAVQHLVDLGHRQIAYVAGDPRTSLGALREQNFRTQMSHQGLPVPEDYVAHGGWWQPGAERATQALLQAESGVPTAIYCGSDELAMAVCRVLRKAGLRVPQDVSVVGYSDLAMSELFDPGLTTVRVPFEEMGHVAVRRLLDLQGGNAVSTSPLVDCVPVRFITRDSSGPVRIKE
jgi:DNA-binding LacI/PurR family transcriptional regulator